MTVVTCPTKDLYTFLEVIEKLQYNEVAILVDVEGLPKEVKVGTTLYYREDSTLSFYDTDEPVTVGRNEGERKSRWIIAEISNKGLKK